MHRWMCTLALLAFLSFGGVVPHGQAPQPTLGARVVDVLNTGGLLFKDLNKNGTLDAYEDWRRPTEERVSDLVGQMTIEEKAGMMVGPTLNMGPNGTVSEHALYSVNPFAGGPEALSSPATSDALYRRHITQFINRANTDARTMANWLNEVQRLAEGTRLGIPAFFVTNPRNHISGSLQFGINEAANAFSQWPGTLGLAATRDVALVEEFASIAAREYVAVGIRGAYHPQIDLATEPRWGRIDGTFGEDAELTAAIARALVRGFQGKALGPQSVALTVKHFPGGGAAKGGLDSHFPAGKFQVYPGRNFDYHVTPFRAAIDEGAAAMMPYYSIPQGQTSEEVGMAFNKDIVTGLLRGKLGFKGIVNSDSGITTGMPWGVEALTVKQRYKKAIEAGVDLIGNDVTPEFIVELVKDGELTEARVDESVRRILRVRFALGIFENPYVNPEAAARIVRSEAFQAKGDLAQRKSIVLLKNDRSLLPLKPGTKMYVEGVDLGVAAKYGYASAISPELADVCVLRINIGGPPSGAARGPRSGAPGARGGPGGPGAPGGRGAAGRPPQFRIPFASDGPIDLTVPRAQLDHVRAIMKVKPTIVAVTFDRPWVVPEIASEAAALLAIFGVTDEALLDVLLGRVVPTGKLPFELPSTMEAVTAQHEDVPHDSTGPLYQFGAGLTYGPAAKTN